MPGEGTREKAAVSENSARDHFALAARKRSRGRGKHTKRTERAKETTT